MLDNSLVYLLHKVVFELDRTADKLVRAHLGMSYKRALFLIMLQYHGTVTQHQLALALGYSDPAVSTMLLELVKAGYVTTTPSPDHGRKRLVAITAEGNELADKSKELLESAFDRLMLAAGVNAQQYGELTERLHQALVATTKKE